MRGRTWLVGCVLIAFAGASADGAIFYARTDRGASFDWTSRESYVTTAGGTTTPASDPTTADSIYLPDGFSGAVTNGSAAFALLANCQLVRLTGTAELEISVPEGTAEWNSPVNEEWGKIGFAAYLVKTGGGRLNLNSCVVPEKDSEITDYYISKRILGGTVHMADISAQGNVKSTKRSHGSLHLAEGTKLVVGVVKVSDTDAGTEDVYGTLTGYGSVTNENGKMQVLFRVRGNSKDGYYSFFHGTIDGAVLPNVVGYHLDLDNPMSTANKTPGTYFDGGREPVFGLTSFTYSDRHGVGFYTTGFNFVDSGTYLYLGEGEANSRAFYMGGNRAFTFDAGAHGGITFNGVWSPFSDFHRNTIVYLTGSNSVAAVFAGEFPRRHSTLNENQTGGPVGELVSARFVKNGTGVWKFADNTKRFNGGVIEVNDGTLQFTSLAETNAVCSLGLANALFSSYLGTYDASKRVDYAFELGATNGHVATFEYVGSTTVDVSTRRTKLKGDARLKSESADLKLSGFDTLNGASATLRLAGDRTGHNTVRDVTNATGRISIVKEGAGTWTLAGEQTFKGDVTVNGGRLAIRRPGRYTWFKFILKENYAGKMGLTSGNYRYFQVGELGLFDAQGKRHNIWLHYEGLTRDSGYQNIPEHSFKLLNTSSKDHPLETIVDDSTTNCPYSATSTCGNNLQCSSGIVPTRTNEQSWVTILMRLKDDTPVITGYDIVNCTAVGNVSQLLCWELQGSLDGKDWVSLSKSEEFIDEGKLPAINKWISNGVDHKDDEASAPDYKHGGMSIENPLYQGVVPDVFTHVDSVKVADGAELYTSDDVTIRGLTVDRLGAGRVTGFNFAEEGTLDVLNPGGREAFDLPIAIDDVSGSVTNLSRWSVRFGGVDKNRTLSVKPDGTVTVDQAPGLLLIVK